MRTTAIWIAVSAFVLASTPAHAVFFLNFENGTDGSPVTDINGVSFQSFNGFPSIYGDSSTGNYNTTSDDLNQTWNAGSFHHNGFFWLWAGPNANAQGVKVDFTQNNGTWFTTGYSSASSFTVEVHHTDATSVNFVGAANTGGPMGYINAVASAGKFIDYVVLHDTGNAWLVDDMSGDADGVSTVPEPSTLVILGLGLVCTATLRRRRRAGAQ